jgi:hypothetical protein
MIGLGFSMGMVSRVPGSAWHPAALFRNSEAGVVYDINPLTCGVVVNQAVATLSDSSGNNRNATQATSSARPVLRQSGELYYLEFDGVNDAMQTAALAFAGSDEVTVIAGLHKNTNSAVAMALEYSTNFNANTGSFFLTAPGSTGGAADYGWTARGSGYLAGITTGTVFAPDTSVVTAVASVSPALRRLRRNGVQVASSTTSIGAGGFGNYPLFIGHRSGGSYFFNGRLYGLILINRQLSATELLNAERWMATKAGVTLA